MYRYIRQDWKSEYIYGMRKHKKYIANKTKLINSNKISLRHLIGTSRIFVLRDYQYNHINTIISIISVAVN